MNTDLNAILNAFTKWYENDPHHLNHDAYPELSSISYLEKLSKEEFVDFFFMFVKEGGKIQSGGHRTAGKFKQTIEEDYKTFRSFVLEPFYNEFNLDDWLRKVENFNHFGQGAATIYLNRINKNRFAIVNNKSINALRTLGYEVKGDFVQTYHSIENAQKDLITKHPLLKDYYITDALTHFLIGTKDGQAYLPDPFLRLIFNYIDFKNKVPHSDEFYKYEAVKHFQDNWDIDAPDFAEMLNKALKKQINLMYQYSYGTIKKVATAFPEETREQFRNLFDEKKDITSRINSFEQTVDSLMKKIDENRSGFQDERAVSVYLTFMYPDKYYFFKDSYYSKFVELFNKKKAGKGLKYASFIWLCNDFKEKYVKNNDELWQLTNAILPTTAWPDSSRNILTQDILYCGLDQKETVNYWFFQCNPKEHDIANEWKNIEEETWRVTAHKNEIKAGDKVIIWVVGKESGCYGLCTITSDVLSDEDGSWVEMNIDHNFTQLPILKSLLDKTDDFKDKRNSQGSNFKATKEQYETILKFATYNGEELKLIQYAFEIGDWQCVNFHFEMIDEFIQQFGIKEDDKRVVFSTPDSRDGLTVTVNQRYIFKTTKDSYRINLPVSILEGIKQHSSYNNHEIFKDHSGNDSKEVYIYLKKDRQLVENYKRQWLETCKANLVYGMSSGFIKYDNPAYRKAVFDKAYREQLLAYVTKNNNESVKQGVMKNTINFPKNLILYGPPGTGKTYNTIARAMEIVASEIYERYKNDTDRSKLNEEFNRLKKGKQIEFVTFHQSYGYEEFVEGIKPVISSRDEGDDNHEEMIYKVCNGIFKNICNEAEIGSSVIANGDSVISSEARVYKVSLKGERNKATKQDCFDKNEIRIGWEKTGPLDVLFENTENNDYFQKLGRNDKNSLSYFYGMAEGDIALICKDSKTIDAIGVITGDYIFDESLSEYNHVRKVKWLLKERDISIFELNGNTNLTLPTVYQLSRITPAMVSKLVLENSGEIKAIKKEPKNYVLIIDEINRGNISKIFGELITLIEPDKRQGEPNALEVTLPYSKSKFSVPSNLYIIGTMNTADRSIALIDTALRRRFEFKEMMPDYDLVKDKTLHLPKEIDYARLLKTINQRIEFLLDRDHVIGHSYFIGLKDYEAFVEKFHLKIIPLLLEYFYNDWAKVQLVLGDNKEWGKPEDLKIVVENKGLNSNSLFGTKEFDDEYKEQFQLNPQLVEKNYNEIVLSVFSTIYSSKDER